MNELVESHKFYDNGEEKREEENFQNYLFKNIDLRVSEKNISFFRSDFRSAKIIASHFYKNNFDRADFTDSYIEDSTFSECYFGTDFINTYFRNVRFQENIFETCTVHDCYFDTCEFTKDKISGTGYKNCVFINCKILNSEYEMNTLTDLSFANSEFISICFADSNSQNLDFKNCVFSGFTIDPDCIGSYLFSKTELHNIKFKYLGKAFSISDEMSTTIQSLQNFYLEKKRYPEFLNCILIYDSLVKSNRNISEVFKAALQKIMLDDHSLRKRSNISNIFRLLKFYSDGNMILCVDFCNIINTLENTDCTSLSMIDMLEFKNQVTTIKALFENSLLDETSGKLLDDKRPMYLEIKTEEEDYPEVNELLNSIFTQVRDEYFPGNEVSEIYQVVGLRKGSLYVDIIGYTGAVMALCTAIKSLIKVYVLYNFSKAVVNLIDKDKKTNDLKKAAEILPILMRGTSDNMRDYATRLSRRMKSIKIFPNSAQDNWY
jgi:uncharacterized protein YjbI with pentapeptide repeats